MRFALLVAALALTGCKSEQECADEMEADIMGFYEVAMKAGDYKMAKLALETYLRPTTIRLNKHMDACDYYADPPYIRKK
ncbi:hypothetical protein LZG00_15875 [Rhodobacteraceae bacterium LMO-12]|nr:hypothetical protein [Rhodobacteraceae bacterium LMO-JJ12]